MSPKSKSCPLWHRVQLPRTLGIEMWTETSVVETFRSLPRPFSWSGAVEFEV